MGNFVDKSAVKQKNISMETPFSAGTLHRFLSAHPPGAGVELQNSSGAPVIKVRYKEPGKLDSDGRKAWSDYLYYLHDRLVGTKEAVTAGAKIESLLKEEQPNLTVGMLLVPLDALMAAEQARLSRANGLVKRWLANEKEVLQIALQLSDDTQPRNKIELDKAALETACNVLSRFSDCKNGEIDSSKILDEAFDISNKLSEDEYKKLGRSRMILMMRKEYLGSFIGAEAPGLVDLCSGSARLG